MYLALCTQWGVKINMVPLHFSVLPANGSAVTQQLQLSGTKPAKF